MRSTRLQNEPEKRNSPGSAGGVEWPRSAAIVVRARLHGARPGRAQARRRRRLGRWLRIAVAAWAIFTCCGCQQPLFRGESRRQIREVRLVFDNNPWLNMDRPVFDPKPEGIQFRILLIPGNSPLGELRDDGTFSFELYERASGGSGAESRKLVASYQYKGAQLHRSRDEKAIGKFYFVRMHWMPNDLSGKEIELQTTFKPAGDGHVIAASPMRLLVPKEYF